MQKCRICLLNNSDIRQINELHEGISYSSMLNYVADIQVVEDNVEFICHLCCQKLTNSYFFRQLIIRSNQERNVNPKVFKFDSLTDVKAQILKESYLIANRSKEMNKTLPEYHSDDSFHNKTHNRRLRDVNDKLTAIYNLEIEGEEDSNEDAPNDSVENQDKYYNVKKKKKENGIAKEHKKKVKKKLDKTCEKGYTVENIVIKPIYLEGLRLITPKRRTNGKRNLQIKKTVVQEEKTIDICPYCGISTTSMKTHLLEHTVSEQFECNDCARRFYTKSSLVHHIKSHLNVKIFKCDKCVASFNNKGGLKQHMLIHTDIKDHICHICSKAFRMKGDLQRHIFIHNRRNSKSFTCEVCDLSFYNNYSLKSHSRVHTGERPFSCKICSKTYGYKAAFNRHCLDQHGVLIERRPVFIMDQDTLKKEKLLMRDLMLRVHGIPTERDPLDAFEGPQKALAFERAVKAMKNLTVPIDVQL